MTLLRVGDLVEIIRQDYAGYAGRPLEGIHQYLDRFSSQQILAEAWNESNPKTPAAVNKYYQTQEAYVEDLAWFNTRPYFWKDIWPMLQLWPHVADFGGGIGSLALALAWIGNDVAYIDLPSPQREFAEWRFKKHYPAKISVHDSLKGLQNLDAVVATDTIEHLHPKTLPKVARQMWDALKPHGRVLTMSKFGKSDTWPMHYDTEDLFYEAMREAGFYFDGPQSWIKNGNHRRT